MKIFPTLVYTKTSASQKEIRCLANITSFAESRYIAPTMQLEKVTYPLGNVRKAKFSNTSQRPTLQAGPSKDSSLKPAYVNSFLHNCMYQYSKINYLWSALTSKEVNQLNGTKG